MHSVKVTLKSGKVVRGQLVFSCPDYVQVEVTMLNCPERITYTYMRGLIASIERIEDGA